MDFIKNNSWKNIVFFRPLILINRFRREIVAAVFTFYGIYLRFSYLAKRDFWTDEIYSLNMLQGPFKPVWQRINYTDFTFFPGEYIVNWPFVWMFKTNKWLVSIPHVLFTLAGFYLLYLICKRYLRSFISWIAVFALVAAHKELVIHSFELRPYAVLPVLSLAVFYFTEEIVSSRFNLSLKKRIWIGLLFIFTIIYHSHGAIILFFTFAYFLLCESGSQSLGKILKHNYRFMSILVIIGLPLFLWYSLGNPEVSRGLNYNVFEYIANPLVNFFSFFKTVACCLVGNKVFYFLAVFLIFPFFLPFKDRFRQIGFLLVLIILPVLVIFHVSLTVKYWFLQRQFIWVMPLTAFIISWCVDSALIFARQKFKGGEK